MARPIAPIEERRLLGISLFLIGFVCFTLVDTSAKWLTLAGLPTTEVVFLRYAGQLVLVAAVFGPVERSGFLVTRNWKLEIVRGVCLLFSTVLNFFAIVFLPLTITSSIAFAMPLVLCALSIPLLGEHVGWRRWIAIVSGFVGVLIIIQPGTADFHPAVFLSLTSVVFTALYMVLTRKLAGVDSVSTQQFYAALVATVCIAPFAFDGWTWPSTADGWLALVGIGTAALVGHQLITTAHRFAPATVLAPFGYVQIIWMSLSSWLIFNQPPTVWIFVGGPIVIGSGLYIWLRERMLQKSIVTSVVAE